MNAKKILIILGAISVVLVLVRLFAFGGEDSWMKNETGQYVEHGVPSYVPDYVTEQQEAIMCAINLYRQKREDGMVFSSQCLGTCGNFAVDIVNVPRNAEDDKTENQCADYKEGKATHFIELDQRGSIFRIE